jgi:hypothetical protein
MNSYNQDESTSKRISFQSIFSSLCNLHQGGKFDFSQLEDMAHAVNKRLHEMYPTESEPVPVQRPIVSIGEKQKPLRCPQCGKMSVYHNKGISKKSGAPYENHKCSNKDCGYIKWATKTYDQHKEEDRARKQQSDLDYLEELQENYVPRGFDESEG